MAFKCSKDKKIRGIKGKNTKEIEFRDDDNGAAAKWFATKHTEKIKKAIDKIKFKK